MLVNSFTGPLVISVKPNKGLKCFLLRGAIKKFCNSVW